MNNASIPNFSFLGSLEVAQIDLPRVVGWFGSHSDYNGTGQLELSLAKELKAQSYFFIDGLRIEEIQNVFIF